MIVLSVSSLNGMERGDSPISQIFGSDNEDDDDYLNPVELTQPINHTYQPTSSSSSSSSSPALTAAVTNNCSNYPDVIYVDSEDDEDEDEDICRCASPVYDTSPAIPLVISSSTAITTTSSSSSSSSPPKASAAEQVDMEDGEGDLLSTNAALQEYMDEVLGPHLGLQPSIWDLLPPLKEVNGIHFTESDEDETKDSKEPRAMTPQIDIRQPHEDMEVLDVMSQFFNEQQQHYNSAPPPPVTPRTPRTPIRAPLTPVTATPPPRSPETPLAPIPKRKRQHQPKRQPLKHPMHNEQEHVVDLATESPTYWRLTSHLHKSTNTNTTTTTTAPTSLTNVSKTLSLLLSETSTTSHTSSFFVFDPSTNKLEQLSAVTEAG